MYNPKQSVAAKLDWRVTFEAIGFGSPTRPACRALEYQGVPDGRVKRRTSDQGQKLKPVPHSRHVGPNDCRACSQLANANTGNRLRITSAPANILAPVPEKVFKTPYATPVVPRLSGRCDSSHSVPTNNDLRKSLFSRRLQLMAILPACEESPKNRVVWTPQHHRLTNFTSRVTS